MSYPFAKISFTAKLAAYMRQFSDIPFASDVADIVGARRAFEGLLRQHAMRSEDLHFYAPIFEARHKSLSVMIRRARAQQVLELAAGLSTRGLALTSDPKLRYVETDLPEPVTEKHELLAAISRRHRLLPRNNLRVTAADALDRDQLLQIATTHMQAGLRAVIVHEGLLQYLSSSETEKVALNIHELLGRFGGVWITPDFSLKGDAANFSDQQRKFQAVIAEVTERTLYNNAFENIEHLREYFRALGFQVEVFNQLYLAPHITSMERLRLKPELLDELRPRLRLWSLTRLG